MSFKGRFFPRDPGGQRSLLLQLIAEKGQSDAETVVYRFLRMSVEEKAALQLQGADLNALETIQASVEGVLKQVQGERTPYLSQFQTDAAAATRELLIMAQKELKKQELLFTDTYPAQPVKPDLDGMRGAARELATSRKAADAAAKRAEDANRTMVDQNVAPAPFPFGAGTTPQVPYFPNPELRQAAGAASDAWFTLEQSYGALRTEKEKAFPSLAMYAYNDDGKAAERLDDLPTWGLWADSRMKDKVWRELRQRLMDNERSQEDMRTDDHVWSLPKMLDLTTKQRKAEAHQQRWIKDEAARHAAEAKEREKLIAAVAIGIAVTTTALTLGAALPAEGTVAAAVLSSMAAGGQGASAGLTIALAYRHLEQLRSESAASDTSLDKANSIASGDPSFLWLALDLVAVALELAALKGAFQAMRSSIIAARETRDLARMSEEIAAAAVANKVPPATAESITAKAGAELKTLPPRISLVTEEAALQRLAQLDSIPAGERGQVVLDALRGGNVAEVLARTGKSATELLEMLGKESAAGQRLSGLLSKKAFDEVGPELKALGLDDAAIARIVTRADPDKIKGQILEEMLEVETSRTLAASAENAERKVLLKGATGEQGTPEFIAGRRISDVHHDALTDGVVGILKDSPEGEKLLVVIRAFEGKAGAATKSQLSMKALRSKDSRLVKLSLDDQNELIHTAGDILRARRKDLARLSTEELVDRHPQELLDIVESIPQNEWGQAHKTSQRLGIDVHPKTGEDIPASILVDGVPRKVVFPRGGGRPQVTGVVPSDVSKGRLGPTVTKKQGVKLDLMNVKGVDTGRLKSLSTRIAEIRGLKVKQ